MTPILPVFVCLNLQRGVIDSAVARSPELTLRLANAHACLGWARRHGLPIMHVFSTRRFGIAEPVPLQGFQAASTEMVAIKNSLSMFDDAHAASGLSANEAAIVIGFTGHEDCLAAALDARRRNLPLLFVTDAISSPLRSKFDGDTVDTVLGDVLGALTAQITTSELLARELLPFRRATSPADAALIQGDGHGPI